MIDPNQIPAYDDETLGSLLKDIITRSNSKSKRIEDIIDTLAAMIDGGKQIAVVSIIRDYIDLDLKNEEKIVKAAQIVQRLATAQAQNTDEDDMGGFITEIDKSELQDIAKELKKENDELNVSEDTLKKRVEQMNDEDESI